MFRFKFKARPKSRRPRFGGSGSPSKRTRGGSMNRLRKKTDKRSEEEEIKKSPTPLTERQKSFVKQGFDETGIIEGQGGFGLPAPKKFKSKEEQTKAEKEAEANVNRRLANRDKDKEAQRKYFQSQKDKEKNKNW